MEKTIQPRETLKTIALIKEFKQNPNNESVITELFNKYDKLIRSLAGSYCKSQDIFEDLVQVGRTGLFAAISRFDPNYNVKFESYALPTIKGEMKRYIRDCTWSLKVPRKYKDLSYKFNAAIEELEVELQRSPLIQEVADKLSVSQEDILHTMEVSNNYKALSLNQNKEDIGDGNQLSLLDKVPSKKVKCIDEIAENKIVVENMLQALTEREQKIIYYLYFKQLSQKQVGEEMGISQMHVSRLHKRALKKLRSEYSHFKNFY